jgi:ankyrin repeat protein
MPIELIEKIQRSLTARNVARLRASSRAFDGVGGPGLKEAWNRNLQNVKNKMNSDNHKGFLEIANRFGYHIPNTVRNRWGNTVLQNMIARQNMTLRQKTPVMFKLIRTAKNVNVRSNADHHQTALRRAIGEGWIEVVRRLLEKGANPNQTDDGDTMLMLAVPRCKYEIVKLLLAKGADVNAKDRVDYTALILSIQYGCVSIVKLLLENGADVNAKDNLGGYTALMHAIFQCDMTWNHRRPVDKRDIPDMVKLLLKNGADVNAKDNLGETALIQAAKGCSAEIVKLLLKNGADVYARDNGGYTALMSAGVNGSAEIAKLLLAKGADVNAKTTFMGKTALMEAAVNGSAEIVKLLLAKGADVNAKDRLGKTALTLATSHGRAEIAELLLKHQGLWKPRENSNVRRGGITRIYPGRLRRSN